MTTPTHPLRTAEEMRDFIHRALDDIANDNIGEAENTLHEALARIPPPDPRHEGLRERIERHLSQPTPPEPYLTAFIGDGAVLLRDCLAALEPAAPQPSEWPEFLIDCMGDKLTTFDQVVGYTSKLECEAARERPTADDVVRAVYDALCDDETGQVLEVAERAIRAAFKDKP